MGRDHYPRFCEDSQHGTRGGPSGQTWAPPVRGSQQAMFSHTFWESRKAANAVGTSTQTSLCKGPKSMVDLAFEPLYLSTWTQTNPDGPSTPCLDPIFEGSGPEQHTLNGVCDQGPKWFVTYLDPPMYL